MANGCGECEWETSCGGCLIVGRRVERGGMVGGDARGAGGAGTRERALGRRFSFPLTLLVTAADFFRVSTDAPPSLGESVRVELVKPVEAGRLDGCCAGGSAGSRVSVPWRWAGIVRPS